MAYSTVAFDNHFKSHYFYTFHMCAFLGNVTAFDFQVNVIYNIQCLHNKIMWVIFKISYHECIIYLMTKYFSLVCNVTYFNFYRTYN